MPPRKLSLPDSAALSASGDARRVAPSAERNAAPILAELTRLAPKRGRVLEIASGTGQHAAQFAAALPDLDWQPSDANPKALASISAWVEAVALSNLRPPILLDASAPRWAERHYGYDLVMTVNLLHLISDAETAGVLDGMARSVVPGGLVLMYGPFLRGGKTTSDGDAAFHASLRAQDSLIGYKDLDDISAQLQAGGLSMVETIAMPANNLMLCARRWV